MKTKQQLLEFIINQDGAVTVDFVVLTAGVVLIAAAATATLTTKVTTAISGISL